MSAKETILVSSCLAGLCTRYDGRLIPDPDCIALLQDRIWIPVCPEQLGGLATPRSPADIVGGGGDDVLSGHARVICRDGSDVTEAFIKGARQVLEICRKQDIREIILKARSPSCGVSKPGVTAALLQKNGFSPKEMG